MDIMKTAIQKVDASEPDLQVIEEAAELLKMGNLVAFPTDTVYGLAADAANEKAVRSIFAAKKRDGNKPLQVLIAQKSDLQTLTNELTDILERIVSEFWPGPLTIVIPMKESFPHWASCGRNTVGVRMPANPVAIKLIKAFGAPVAATSANLSGHPDPMSAGQVAEYLNGKVNLILDGGQTSGGIPSTVLDMSTYPPTVLRRGKLSDEALNKILRATP